MDTVIIDTRSEHYNADDIRGTLTVGELIDILEQYDPEAKVLTGHDGRYSFGGIRERDISSFSEDEYLLEG